MICSQCGTQNEAGRKFCMECGTRLASGCPSCGAQNPDAAKFCGECGTPLNDSAAPHLAPHAAVPSVALTAAAERRLVSVLFADLVGYTTISEDLDPEDARDFLTRYFELTRTVIERYGGSVEKFIGDAVMAVWGAPIAHEDDAERAVRAALDIVDGVPALGDQFKVQVRAGVLTGEAAVTVGATGQGMIAGDLVNTASRLQSVAPPGSVLVGEATHRATKEAIRFEEAGEQLLKGKQAPVPAWRAMGVLGLRGGSGRSGTLEPPFTGRDEELRLLKDLFHATQRESKPRLVAVVGEGGIGKSRLAWEFEKYTDGVVDSVYWHYGRSPAYGEGISYWALAEMVRGRAGIAETDEPDAARASLRAATTEWLADDAERRWVEPRLGALLALEEAPSGSRDELFAAWRTFFERISERGPVVMVFEDLQWADDGMLDFVVELLDRSRSRPIFVVTLARPELNERRPGWTGSLRNLTQMSLEPLSDEQMAEMVRGTVPGIPDEATQAIVERADGIPLYAVETIRMLLDRGELLASGEGGYEMRGRLDRLAVPETLHALIAARLDALGEGERRLIQSAAVLGQSFTAATLAAIAGAETSGVTDRLANLAARQLLTVDIDPRSPERGQYHFVQAVVREVAEGSLSRTDRRALHLAAARHFESLGDDELAGVLASHYVDAFRASAPGPEADALAAQARVSLRGAAERAMSLHSYRQALTYLEQALAVTSDRAELVALHERAANAADHHGLFDAALEHARAVESLSREDGDRLGVLRGITQQAAVHMSQHGERAAIEILRPALEAAADLPPSTEMAGAQAELARALMIGGAHFDESIEWCNRVLAAPDMATDQVLIETLITKGTALTYTPRQREGEVVLRGAMQVAERLGLIFGALRARNNLLHIVGSDDVAAGRALVREGYSLAERYGMRTWSYQFAHIALSDAFEAGNWDAWLDETAALEAPGFYAAWRLLDVAQRSAFRGNLDEAWAEVARGKELAGTTSTQAITAIAATEAGIHLAAGDLAASMAAARVGWSLPDNADPAIERAILTAVAANDRDWMAEVAEADRSDQALGAEATTRAATIATCVAMLDGRWPEARTQYRFASQRLAASGKALWLASLNLAVGTRAAGRFPEAAEALSAAEAFFESVGARFFFDRYQSIAVKAEPDARRSNASTTEVAAG